MGGGVFTLQRDAGAQGKLYKSFTHDLLITAAGFSVHGIINPQHNTMLPPAQRANVIQNDLTSQGQNCFPSSGGTPLFSSSSAPTSPHPNTDCLLLLFYPYFFHPSPTDSLLQLFGSAGALCVPVLRRTGINRSNKCCCFFKIS